MHCRCRSSPAWQHGTPASHCGINQTWESAKKSPTSYWARWWQLHCCQLNAPGTHIDAAAQRHAGALGSLALGAAFSRSSRCSMVASSKLSAAVGTGGRASAEQPRARRTRRQAGQVCPPAATTPAVKLPLGHFALLIARLQSTTAAGGEVASGCVCDLVM
jgi:hypothetical protein